MKNQITIDELKTILQSREFKSTFKDRMERPVFTFRDGYIAREGDTFGKYEITKQGDKLKISISGTKESLFTEIYRNIIFIVEGDARFPITLNFNLGTKDIILEAKPL